MHLFSLFFKNNIHQPFGLRKNKIILSCVGFLIVNTDHEFLFCAWRNYEQRDFPACPITFLLYNLHKQ